MNSLHKDEEPIDKCKLLWSNTTIKEALKGNNAYYALDAAYLLDRIDGIFSDKYTVCNEDFINFFVPTIFIWKLPVRVTTQGHVGALNLRNCPGNRHQRAKWITMDNTNDVNTIIYHCPIGDYDNERYEDGFNLLMN